MTYKIRKKPNYVPLSRFVREAKLPKKAQRKLKGATFISETKCDVCGEQTLRLYKVKAPAVGGRMVCTNPNCEVYGVVMPI